MRIPILALSFLLATVARADDWELSAFQSTQTVPTHQGFQGTSDNSYGLRLGYSLGMEAPVLFRLEGIWMPRNRTEVQALNPTFGLIMPVGRVDTNAETLSLRAESWFWGRFACVSASVDERLNHVAYSPVNGGAVMGYGSNNLLQTWARIGVGGRIWFFGMADLGRDQDSSWYPILRLEWAAAISPKGQGISAELLPRQEFSFSLGFRF